MRRTTLKSGALVALKATATALVVVFFVRTIDGAELGGILAGAAPGWLAMAGVLSLGSMLLAAQRFIVLIAGHTRQPFARILRHCFIGMFFNQLLPTAVGGDAMRVLLLKNEGGVPATEGAVFVLAERALGLCALGLLALLATPFAGLPDEIAWLPVATGVPVLVGGAVLAFIARSRAVERLPGRLLRQAAAAFAALLGRPRALLGAAALGITFQVLAILQTWLIAVALDLPMSFAAALALVPLVYIASVLPISLGGVGLRELAFVVLFRPLGLSEEACLAVALGTFVSLSLPGVVGGVAWLIRPERSRAPNAR